MARKKNKTIEQAQSIGYSGRVKVTLVRGKKVISEKEFKNNGRWPLFNFLALCIKGEFNEAKNLRPKYIRLFTAGTAGVTTVPVPTDQNAFPYGATNLSLNVVPLNSSSNITKTEAETSGSASVTLKYLIPLTQISGLTNYRNINLLAMYYGSDSTYVNQPSAYCFIKDENNESLLGEIIEGIPAGSDPNQYNLIIDWTMSLANI